MRGWLAIVAMLGTACGHHDGGGSAGAASASGSGSASGSARETYEVPIYEPLDAPTADLAPPPPVVDDLKGARGHLQILEPQAFDESSLTPTAVADKFRSAYAPSVLSCYQKTLARDATARGKLQVGFTVKDSGHVDEVTVTGFDDALSACVKEMSAGWAFVRPKDKDGAATSAAFKLTIQLVPS